jgi:intracellular septation protein
MPENIKTANGMSPWLRLALEAGPLLLFFVINARAGIMPATGVFMVATLVSLAICYAKERRLPTMPLVTGVFVLIFGGLTLAFDDDFFIKLKPTIVNGLFALALFAGLALRRNLLKILLEAALQLDDAGWRKLTWRWAWFFVVLAALNEVVWRTQSTDFWIAFKLWGVLPLTIAFSASQFPLILRHTQDDEPEPT